MSNLLASSYSFLSSHVGFNLLNSSHSMLWNRIKEIVLTAILGCWLTRGSPKYSILNAVYKANSFCKI